jgi:hypothetical protein
MKKIYLSAVAVSLALLGGPVLAQAADQMRASVERELVLMGIDADVAAMSDQQVMEIYQAVGDCSCNATEAKAQVEAILN